MLRPSRPMIRPFMSSLGRAKTLTVDSAVCSEATRWIAIVRIFRARSSPSSRACCSISRTCAMAERLASSTTWRDQLFPGLGGRHAGDPFELDTVLVGGLLQPERAHRGASRRADRARRRGYPACGSARGPPPRSRGSVARAGRSRRGGTSRPPRPRDAPAPRPTLASSLALRRTVAASWLASRTFCSAAITCWRACASRVFAEDFAMLARTRNPTVAPATSATTPTITGIMMPPCKCQGEDHCGQDTEQRRSATPRGSSSPSGVRCRDSVVRSWDRFARSRSDGASRRCVVQVFHTLRPPSRRGKAQSSTVSAARALRAASRAT